MSTKLIGHGKVWFRWLGCLGLVGLLAVLSFLSLPAGGVKAQQPTGSVPTVTGTPPGASVTVYADPNEVGVFSGPSADTGSYAQIGILIAGETVPALGYSTDGKWIQIIYLGVKDGKGWIYAPYVKLSPGFSLPDIESPPTITPATTPTLDPTYVAAYGLTLEPTKLATFTSPGALQIPTFAVANSGGSTVPFGLIIFGLIFIGVLGAVVSFLRGGR
jgi:hypothetical protein